MTEDIRLRADNLPKCLPVALQVRYEQLDPASGGSPANFFDQGDKMTGAPVSKVVARHRGDHCMLELQFEDGLRDLGRFLGIRWAEGAAVNITEAAMPTAIVAEDHEGCGSLTPAFPLVRAGGTATDRIQTLFAVITINSGKVLPRGESDLEPVRLALIIFRHRVVFPLI